MQITNNSNYPTTNFRGQLDKKSVTLAKKVGEKAYREAERYASKLHKDTVVTIKEEVENGRDVYLVSLSNKTMGVKKDRMGAMLKEDGVDMATWFKGCSPKLTDIDMYNTAVYKFAKELADKSGIKINPFAVKKYHGLEFVNGGFLR